VSEAVAVGASALVVGVAVAGRSLITVLVVDLEELYTVLVLVVPAVLSGSGVDHIAFVGGISR
jgi:hypothetical protein